MARREVKIHIHREIVSELAVKVRVVRGRGEG